MQDVKKKGVMMETTSQLPSDGAPLIGTGNVQYWPVDYVPELIAIGVILAFFSIPLLFVYSSRRKIRMHIERMEEPSNEYEFSDEPEPPHCDPHETKTAREVFEEVRQIAAEEGNGPMEIRALWEIALAHFRDGSAPQGREAVEELLQLSKGKDGEEDYCANLIQAATMYCEFGAAHEAIEVAEASLAIARGSGNPTLQSHALNILACEHENVGNARRAGAFREEGQRAHSSLVDARGEAQFEWRCAKICHRMGKHRDAMVHGHKAVRLFDMVRDPQAGEIEAEIRVWDGMNDE